MFSSIYDRLQNRQVIILKPGRIKYVGVWIYTNGPSTDICVEDRRFCVSLHAKRALEHIKVCFVLDSTRCARFWCFWTVSGTSGWYMRLLPNSASVNVSAKVE